MCLPIDLRADKISAAAGNYLLMCFLLRRDATIWRRSKLKLRFQRLHGDSQPDVLSQGTIYACNIN
jgi:hypothetical protein